jgi:hypothetical protein
MVKQLNELPARTSQYGAITHIVEKVSLLRNSLRPMFLSDLWRFVLDLGLQRWDLFDWSRASEGC